MFWSDELIFGGDLRSMRKVVSKFKEKIYTKCLESVK